jgi:hypothetical protein
MANASFQRNSPTVLDHCAVEPFLLLLETYSRESVSYCVHAAALELEYCAAIQSIGESISSSLIL